MIQRHGKKPKRANYLFIQMSFSITNSWRASVFFSVFALLLINNTVKYEKVPQDKYRMCIQTRISCTYKQYRKCIPIRTITYARTHEQYCTDNTVHAYCVYMNNRQWRCERRRCGRLVEVHRLDRGGAASPRGGTAEQWR